MHAGLARGLNLCNGLLADRHGDMQRHKPLEGEECKIAIVMQASAQPRAVKLPMSVSF